jgi:hypothetical protein
VSRVLALLWLLALAAAALGWGRVLRRLAGRPRGSWPVTAGLGLAALIGAGGVLNLLRVARGPVLVALVVLGAVVLVPRLARARPALPAAWPARVELLLATAVVAGATGFAAATVAAPRVLNLHDDLQKYLAHPARMLATGTLAAGPLSALGLETFGGQAFLQGLLVTVLPLPYAAALDGVLGLGLLLALAAAGGWRRLRLLPGAAIGPTLIAVVNAQVVNVSALYVAAALMATAVLLVADDREAPVPSPLLLGVAYAGMVALKPTFALFPALHLPLAALALRSRTGGARASAGWALRVALAAAILLAPWIALHAPVYLGPRSALPPAPPGWDDPLHLASTAPLFYGTTAAHYTALGAIALLAAAAALVALRQPGASGLSSARRAGGVVAAVVAGVAAALVLVFVTGPLHSGREVGLRYAIPFLLGAAAPAIPLALGLPGPLPRATAALLVAGALGVACSFMPVPVQRAGQAVAHGTLLAYRGAPGYGPYTRDALSDAARARVRRLQELVPPGEPLLAWVNFPYHVDLRRNPVDLVEPTALGSPWARLPPAPRYVLWQYRGLAFRSPEYLDSVARGPGAHERRTARRIAAFTGAFELAVAEGVVLADDGEIRLVRRR